MAIFRTPSEQFAALEDFPYEPHYLSVGRHGPSDVRMHFIDEGPRNGPVVLMLHGEPTWCYLYRHMIPVLTGAGLRVVAPDLVGFGRSDKLPEMVNYSYRNHVNWLAGLLNQLGLTGITLFAQDWGGPIGLSQVAQAPERFNQIVLSNTLLPNCEDAPRGVAGWPSPEIRDWVQTNRDNPDLPVAGIINAVCQRDLTAAEQQAYDTPFPDARYKTGVQAFPLLIPLDPDDPGCQHNREVWQALEQWQHPLSTAYGDSDPTTAAWQAVFRERVPGAARGRHLTLDNCGHFSQEDAPLALADLLIQLLVE